LGGGILEANGGEGTPIRYGRKLELTEEERRRLAPPVEYQYPVRKSRRGLLILVVVVAVAVVTSYLAYAYLIPRGGSSTPEDTFRGIVEAINEENWRKAIDLSVDKFATQQAKDQEVAALVELWAGLGNVSVVIDSIDVTYHNDMGISAKAEMDTMVNQIESMYAVEVTDSCGLDFTWTVTMDGEPDTNDGVMPLVKIGSSWYLAMIPF